MKFKGLISITLFLVILCIAFVVPIFQVELNAFPFYGLYVAMILSALYLLLFDFRIFVPAFYFVIIHILRPLLNHFLTGTTFEFPGIYYLFPSIVYLGIILPFPSARSALKWFRLGRIDRTSWLVTIIMVAGSIAGLYIWARLSPSGVEKFRALLPGYPPALLLLGGIGFAITNAIMEEVIARGVIWDGFHFILNRWWLTNLAQSTVFAIWHFKGFPGGISGALMVFAWSVFLGYLRHRSKGMLAPVVGHFFADIAIFLILVLI